MGKLNDYLTIKEFMHRTLVSDKTIRRLIKKESKNVALDNSPLVVMKNRRLFLHKDLLKQFVSAYYLWLEENQAVNKSYKPVSDYADFFGNMEWTWFCHVAYNKANGVLKCRSIMNSYFLKLKLAFPSFNFRLLYVSEKNPSSEGYHNHFVLFCSGGDKLKKVKDFTDGFFRVNNMGITEVVPYVVERNGINYILKHLSNEPDGWDIL